MPLFFKPGIMKTIRLFFFASLIAFPAVAQNWTHIGPFKSPRAGSLFQPGRLDCLTLDPGFDGASNQKLYAGSMAGGLWATANMGQSWNNIVIPGSIPFHGISALEHSPLGFIVVGTANSTGHAETGGPVYQFDPSANAWTATYFNNVAPAGTRVKDFALFPNDPAVVLAASDQGLYRSADHGLNWNLVLAGDFEKVTFIELSISQGGYQVYASGSNVLVYSNDKGQTFTPHTALINAILGSYSGAGFYADLGATVSSANSNIQYLYVDALRPSLSAHTLIRLEVDKVNLTENMSTMSHGAPNGSVKGRMCVAAHDKFAYFGAAPLCKWGFFYPNFPNYPDFATASQGLDDLSNLAGSFHVHHDIHDIIILPQLNYVFIATDGGFWRNTYTPTSVSSVFNNDWAELNTGLHISQVWGLGISDQDPAKFFTGEQDTWAFLSSTASTTYKQMGLEPSNVIMDKFNSDNYLYRDNNYNKGEFNGTVLDEVNSDYRHYYDHTNTTFCSTNQYLTYPEPDLGWNCFFQDPNRPGHIYHGSKGPALTELCGQNLKEVLKATFAADYQQFVNGMAFSKADKNKVYVSLINWVPNQKKPKLFVYAGANFDNSWYGHNVTWSDCTPADGEAVFNGQVNASNNYLIEPVGIAASDWDADRIWWAVRNVPGNPHLKVLRRSGGVWSDYSQGIPSSEFPVSLAYEQGTNDQLYLGTNVNVYYRSATMSSWQPYSGALPNTCMQQLRINYGDNTLNVGTYGRGVWKSALACPPDFFLVENGNTVADKFVEASGYILGSGIISWGDVKYRAGEYIELQPGFLAAAGGTTGFHAFIHGCYAGGNTFREPQDEGEYGLLEMMSKSELKGEKMPEQRMQIIPNPGNGLFYLERESANDIRIMVYDISGRCLLDRQNVSTQREAIDLSGQPNGLYLVRVLSGEHVESFSIVKQ